MTPDARIQLYAYHGNFNQTHRLRGDSFLSADHANSFSALYLHVDKIRIDPEHLSHLLLHGC